MKRRAFAVRLLATARRGAVAQQKLAALVGS